MSYDLERIQINIQANTSEAVKAYKELAKALTALKKVSSSDFGFRKLADDTNAFARSIRSNLRTIERYANALDKIARARRTRVGGVRKAENSTGGGRFPENNQGATPVDSKEVEGSTDALDDMGDKIDDINDKLKKSNKQSKGFLTNLKDIVKYRILRSILSAIGKSMKEGSENFYGFLSMSNNSQAGEMKKSLDGISSTLLSLKNTLGVTLLSTAITLKPVIESLSEVMITLANGINALMAKVKGSTTYFAANREAIKKWSETVKNSTQGFDELNVLAGNQDTMPSDMYVEKDVDEAIKAFSDEALKIAGVVVAYEGLKKIVELITGSFNKKNSSLKKQSEYASADAVASTQLSGALSKVSAMIIGSTGLIGAFNLLNQKQGELSFSKVTNSLTEMGSAMTSTASAWSANLTAMLKDTSSFVTAINGLLAQIGVTSGSTSTVGVSSGALLGIKSSSTSNVGSAVSAIPSLSGLKVPSVSTSVPAYNQGVARGNSNIQLITDWETAKASMPTNIGEEMLKAFNELVAGSFAGGAVSKLFKVLSPIFGYASGGFVTSDIFMARENGAPEMVGHIGGRTAVANNDQITEAIASAVYDAMMAAGGGNVNVTLEGDAKKLFRVVQDEARQYNRKTGSYAFN